MGMTLATVVLMAAGPAGVLTGMMIDASGDDSTGMEIEDDFSATTTTVADFGVFAGITDNQPLPREKKLNTIPTGAPDPLLGCACCFISARRTPHAASLARA
jgi:hypothetical protein